LNPGPRFTLTKLLGETRSFNKLEISFSYGFDGSVEKASRDRRRFSQNRFTVSQCVKLAANMKFLRRPRAGHRLSGARSPHRRKSDVVFARNEP